MSQSPEAAKRTAPFIYERATEQEYGLDRLPGANVMKRSTARPASRLARAIIANHDQPVTAHDIAAQTPTAALPQRVQRIRDRRAAALQRRRASYQVRQADSESLRAMTRAVERHCSRGPQSRLRGGFVEAHG